jgi:hypothetical protein
MGDNKQSQTPAVEDSSSTVVVSKKTHRGWHKKPDIIIATIVILFLAIIGIINQIHRHDQANKTVAQNPPTICSTSILKQAGTALQSSAQVANLIPIANQIQKLPHYQQDPNCLYVLVAYDVSYSDATNATKNLNLLIKVYNPSPTHRLSIYLQPAKSIADFKADIAAINKNAKQNKLTLSKQPS